ncbi:hypothetical protein VTO73DRAFT_13811, partial [Trametes versicolor]
SRLRPRASSARSPSPGKPGGPRREATRSPHQPQAVRRSISRARRPPTWATHGRPHPAQFSIPT